MKTSLLHSREFYSLSLVIALTFVPGLCFAAGLQAPEAVPVVTKPAGYDLQIVDGKLIRPGGKVEATLANVVDALRDQYTEANIIFSPGLGKIQVSDLKLRSGILVDELDAIRIACGERFEVNFPPGTQAPQFDPNTGLPQTPGRAVNAGLFVLRESIPPAQKQRVVEAFNIGPYLEWLRQSSKEESMKEKAEDTAPQQIQDIIRITLEGFRPDQTQADQPVFQYHGGASLLIVIGNPDTVEIARKIINALPGMSAIADDSRGHFGLEPGRGSGADRASRAAEEAFRARYGLPPRSGPPGQPATTGPEPNLSK